MNIENVYISPVLKMIRLQTKIIKLDPSYYGAIENSFAFKGFQFHFLFQFVKQVANNYDFGTVPPGEFNGGLGNQPIFVMNRWQKSGDNALYQRFSPDINSFDALFGSLYGRTSERAYSDASYIRLKNLSLSYQLPVAWSQKIKIQALRVFMNGQNLWTSTKYKGLDPETKSSGSLPPLRVLTLGVNINL